MDVEELSHLIKIYGKDVYGFCYKLTRDKNQADDLYQQTFLRATELCHKIDNVQNPKGFFIAIAAKMWQNQRRKIGWRHRIVKMEVFQDDLYNESQKKDANTPESVAISAFAAWKLLTPKQVAENMGDEGLAIAFDGEEALVINDTRISGDYKVTLLGIVSGKKISDFKSSVEKIYPDRTYAVVAIANVDGRPMPDLQDVAYDKAPFFVSPFIKGQDPRKINICTMNGGYSGFVKEGIMYRIIECDDIEIFADRGLYLSVTSSMFYDVKAYHFDSATGEIINNTDYEVVNILFVLPLDPSKGNYEKAQMYLQTLIEKQTLAQGFIDEEPIDIEALLAEQEFIPESVEEGIPDEAGMITYHFDGNEFKIALNNLFKEGQSGFSDSRYYDEDIKKGLVFSRDTNGIITVMTYRQKE